MADQKTTLAAGEYIIPAGTVQKHAMLIPVSSEQLADALDLSQALAAYLNSTPQQREQWAREAAERRAAERTAAPRVELTLDALLVKRGWSREYAEHLVQPYCTCEDGMDGWEYCQHSADEGVRP